MARRSCRIKASDAQILAVAEARVPSHHHWLQRGWRLTGSSCLWRTKRAGATGRFVYRHPDGGTLVFVLRGIGGLALG